VILWDEEMVKVMEGGNSGRQVVNEVKVGGRGGRGGAYSSRHPQPIEILKNLVFEQSQWMLLSLMQIHSQFLCN